MEWLLGATSIVGVIGSITLAIYAVRIARDLISCKDELSETELNLAEHRHTVEELSDALTLKINELNRAKESQRMAEVTLSYVRKTLAKNMSTTGIVADIDSTLDRLHKMSAMSQAATESSQAIRPVYGEDASGDKSPGRGDQAPETDG